ncbi:S-layer homology domain-containing protein, partial [Leucobacter sp.]
MRALGALLGAVLIATGVVATAPVVASAEAPAGARVGVVDGLSTRSFSDVPRSHRFYGDISWLAGEGITTGNADGSFAPKRAVTREAMAAFL